MHQLYVKQNKNALGWKSNRITLMGYKGCHCSICQRKKNSRHHNRLWNGGNGWGTVKLYDRQDGQFVLVDEIEATHVGCEYGEYDHAESY